MNMVTADTAAQARYVEIATIDETFAGELWQWQATAMLSDLNIASFESRIIATTTASPQPPTTKVFFLSELSGADRDFAFNYPVMFTQNVEDGVWVIQNKDLGIFVFEESESEARDALAWQFRTLWVDLVEGEIGGPLAPSAKKLADALKHAVKKVRHVGIT